MAVDIDAIETAEALIAQALTEDLQERGDLTSEAVIPASSMATVNVVSREYGTLSGAVLIQPVYTALATRMTVPTPCKIQVFREDGDQLEPGSVIGSVTGPVRALLAGERTTLNFLTHLSGIASLTAKFVSQIHDSPADVLDTRKTLPGYRTLQKYAVRCGGGLNHRMGLYDGILIKDNHLAARNDDRAAKCISSVRKFLSTRHLHLLVEVEVDSLDQLRDVLTENPDIVLLDNMRTSELQQAVAIRDAMSPDTLLEASGRVTLESIGCIARTGVDRISIGCLTHSAPALDIGYDWPNADSRNIVH
ncbi:MAG: carboxylating nicotinate-nucleotide diphosphorylase [Fuerstiella sp.]|nr:carboxylating nicotinate-nucleotide diphosphorylase [Fuerstiella sp.]